MLAGLFFVVFKISPRSILTVNHSICMRFLYFPFSTHGIQSKKMYVFYQNSVQTGLSRCAINAKSVALERRKNSVTNYDGSNFCMIALSYTQNGQEKFNEKSLLTS